MARGTVNAKNISLKFAKYLPTSVLLGDSHCKHLHNHFHPGRKGTPAFISQSGAKIYGVYSLLGFVPKTTIAIVLHVGTNDVAKSSAGQAFGRYRNFLDVIARDFSSIKRVTGLPSGSTPGFSPGFIGPSGSTSGFSPVSIRTSGSTPGFSPGSIGATLQLAKELLGGREAKPKELTRIRSGSNDIIDQLVDSHGAHNESAGDTSQIKNGPANNTIVTVDDLHRIALLKLDATVRDYYESGADMEQTLRENVEAFLRWRLRFRVLVDVHNRSLKTTMLGREVNMPVGIAPSAMQKMAHADGECGTANASQEAGTVMILSTLCTISLEEIREKAPDAILWLQLYVFKNRSITEDLIRRAECSNFSAIVLTVDAPTWGQRIVDVRNRFTIPENLSLANFEGSESAKFSSATGSGLTKYTEDFFDTSLTWDDVTWLKNATRLPVVLKGIVTAEDAELAVHRKVDAIIVSNHGGRQLDGSPATVEALSEVVEAVRGRIEVYVDGGVRRGTDVIKALALGAKAVFVGRPALWGLAYDGEKGVTKMLEIFYHETRRALALMGHKSVQDLRPKDVIRQERYGFRIGN
ncbi:2-Hydroxyacid oxidase 1-like [Haemaphysalis longicornis]